jgi:hypothetical protein
MGLEEELEKIDEVSVIADSEESLIVLFKNEVGYFPVKIETNSTIDLQLMSIMSNGVGPIEYNFNELLKFLGVNKLEIYIKHTGNTAYSLVELDGKQLGKFNLDGVIYAIFSDKTEITCMKDMLSNEELTAYFADSFLKLDELFKKVDKKIMNMAPPREIEGFKLVSVARNYIQDESGITVGTEYQITFHNGEYELLIYDYPENLPLEIVNYMPPDERLNDDYYQQKEIDGFRLFKKMLSEKDAKPTKVIRNDIYTINSNEIEFISTIPTYFVEIEKGKEKRTFVLPDYIALPIAIELGEIYISSQKIKNRKEETRRNLSINGMYN